MLRATSTICQAFAAGYERVVCAGEVDDARALAGDGVALAGERLNVLIEGFDFGNSPREFARTRRAHSTLVMTTTNGTRLLLAAAARCETVLVASLLNLDAVVEAARASGADDVAVLCAGVEGAFAIDDAYVAGRIAARPRRRAGRRSRRGDPARGLVRDRRGRHRRRRLSAENIRNANLDDDIAWCARESVLDLVPRVVERGQGSVEIAIRRGRRHLDGADRRRPIGTIGGW